MYGESITVVQLAYVRAAAHFGSFSKAATSLGVTQPALSNGVSSLERTIGTQLFDRSRSGATLTPLGRQILPHFLTVLGSVENVAKEIADARLDVTALRLGVSRLIAPGIIARALEAASRHQLGGLVLREDNLVPLRDSLASRQLDLLLIPAVARSDRFASRVLETEVMHYLPQGQTETDGSALELAALASDPLVLVGDACGLTAFTTALFADSGHQLQRYPGEADSYSTLQQWGGLGLGGVLLPRSKFGADAHTRPVLQDGHPVTISYAAVWDPHSAQGSTITALLDAMA
jgi:DNA-binding transcriptional LysR family regulator